MATIRAYTTIEQSRKLAEILPLDSADMVYTITNGYHTPWIRIEKIDELDKDDVCAWSLAALLNILHSKARDIPSLSGGGYKDGKYISDWCLDYEFENGDYQKTFADNPIDACVAIIEKLHELKML